MNENKTNAVELLKKAKGLASSRNNMKDSSSKTSKTLDSVVRKESSTSESINHQPYSAKKQEVPIRNYERREIKDNKMYYKVLKYLGCFSAAIGITALGIEYLTTIQNKPVIKENITKSITVTTGENKNKEEKPQKSIHELIREKYGKD